VPLTRINLIGTNLPRRRRRVCMKRKHSSVAKQATLISAIARIAESPTIIARHSNARMSTRLQVKTYARMVRSMSEKDGEVFHVAPIF